MLLLPIIAYILIHFMGIFVIATAILLWITCLYNAFKIEKVKKEHHLMTFKEIIAFNEGRDLSEIEKSEERGKAPYQKAIIVF